MYDFHYNYIKQKYGNKAKLTYEIETKDIYKDYFKDKNRFDKSDYAENSPFYDKIKGSLSSSWMNSPMPSLLLPLWQNESLSETIGMKTYVTCTVIRMKIK